MTTVLPAAMCACCERPIRARVVWCSQTCRNLDDPHDDQGEPEPGDD
ncbi:hypothetical protein ACFOSC_21860 [Streptantibioticus rubrisoli]|uniref:DUF2256 domain-containing protein n=1 Tax=Streptantibioticus rubrisoli TaxID=1387313 RepID=A0ABT1P876_9ACTN|nr:hypothetical protein [Streptantibioticus rubrisoli]MCQ4040608.1 hypothetical protein [Streptantibioticus rubrisoli]